MSATTCPGAPLVYVSLMEGARSHVAKTSSTTGTFCPYALAATPGKAKHVFPGFTIRFLRDHLFTNSAGVMQTLTHGDYQGQIHWHDGQGRLTIDASSFPLTSDESRHPHFSADFAYYSLLLLLTPVIQTGVSARAVGSRYNLAPSPQQEQGHALATTEYLRIPGPSEPNAGRYGSYPNVAAPLTTSYGIAAAYLTRPKPPPAIHFLADGAPGSQPASRMYSMGPTPFSTPPMPRKALFADSPQLEAQRTKSAAFGHSPGPSPSWEHTPLFQMFGLHHASQSRDHVSFSMRRDDPLSAVPRTTSDTQLQHHANLTQATPSEDMPTHTAHLQQAFVQLVITSSRKRAALGSLSPKIRSIAPQAHTSLASSTPTVPQDPE